jgi:hypothetical protein
MEAQLPTSGGRVKTWGVNRATIICSICAASIAMLGHPCPASAAPAPERPAIIGEIERTFDGAFLFATAGDGRYAVYQRVEDGMGVPPSGEIVCMLHECFLKIAEAPIAPDDRSGIGNVRERFRAARDAYGAMRTSKPDARAAAANAWHDATAEIDRCLRDRDSC